LGPQLHQGWEDAEDYAKKELSSMVFNTFIWCQVSPALMACCHISDPDRSARPARGTQVPWLFCDPSQPCFCSQMFNMLNARKIEDEINVFSGIFTSHIFWVIWVLISGFQVGCG
jgi:hypothetical protein